MGRPLNLLGEVFGRLTVLSLHHSDPQGRWWVCQCECGSFAIVPAKSLKFGKTSSCGCGIGGLRHGHCKGRASPTYNTWRAINYRCHNEKAWNYQWYGGKGIRVCSRWRESFENFLADMGIAPPDPTQPGKAMTLDRRDPTKGYEPDNCRWATKIEQEANKLRDYYARGGDGPEVAHHEPGDDTEDCLGYEFADWELTRPAEEEAIPF